jgi:hypothetical protein
VSDRLHELQRQRALAQEQIAWFDREIARERGEMLPAEASKPVSVSTGKTTASPTAGETDIQAAEIIQRFQKEERPVKDDVRRGCFLYFFSAFLLLGLAAYAFYLLHRPAD